ncbi:hypothetical protein PROFUN_05273 [Planoprotostelium fungivorum]|uniref:Uncharacterized protein n=1 Tax=Planoprotostelium fungivorum TaxID=1890364 RepID=A0A2P6NRA4_9EUKA|nr:hypothetical protein PROFUN_05273 [Planoprotostelium fungivorum]
MKAYICILTLTAEHLDFGSADGAHFEADHGKIENSDDAGPSVVVAVGGQFGWAHRFWNEKLMHDGPGSKMLNNQRLRILIAISRWGIEVELMVERHSIFLFFVVITSWSSLGHSDCAVVCPTLDVALRPKIPAAYLPPPTPNYVHYVYLTNSPKYLNYKQWLGISSCRILNPERVYLHVTHEPKGYWYERIKEIFGNRLTLVKVEMFDQIFGQAISHMAHKSDVVRLKALLEYGGIYFDTDVVVFKDLRLPQYNLNINNYSTVLGAQAYSGDNPGRTNWDQMQLWGICNAFIMAAPNAPFIQEWFNLYRTFNKRLWDFHSVKLPLKLVREGRQGVLMLGPEAMFWPLWDVASIEYVHLKDDFQFNHSRQYGYHLWRYTPTPMTPNAVWTTPDNKMTSIIRLQRMIFTREEETRWIQGGMASTEDPNPPNEPYVPEDTFDLEDVSPTEVTTLVIKAKMLNNQRQRIMIAVVSGIFIFFVAVTSWKGMVRNDCTSLCPTLDVNLKPKISETPNYVHYISLTSKPKFLNYEQFLGISSSRILNPERVYLHVWNEPTGYWYERLKEIFGERFILNKVEPFDQIFGQAVRHPAHKADVLRLKALLDYGGIYFDTDVVVLKDFRLPQYNLSVSNYNVVVGGQAYTTNNISRTDWDTMQLWGICNAFISAGPNSPFIQEWYNLYKAFNKKHWDFHSIKLPLKLYRQNHPEVLLLGPEAWFWPLWDGAGTETVHLKDTFQFNHSRQYGYHMWGSHPVAMTPDKVWNTPDDKMTSIIRLQRMIFTKEEEKKWIEGGKAPSEDKNAEGEPNTNDGGTFTGSSVNLPPNGKIHIVMTLMLPEISATN